MASGGFADSQLVFSRFLGAVSFKSLLVTALVGCRILKERNGPSEARYCCCRSASSKPRKPGRDRAEVFFGVPTRRAGAF